jgi:hypothetical protein
VGVAQFGRHVAPNDTLSVSAWEEPLQGRVGIITVMMEAVRTSERLVNLNRFAQHYNPEDSHLHNHSSENL